MLSCKKSSILPRYKVKFFKITAIISNANHSTNRKRCYLILEIESIICLGAWCRIRVYIHNHILSKKISAEVDVTMIQDRNDQAASFNKKFSNRAHQEDLPFFIVRVLIFISEMSLGLFWFPLTLFGIMCSKSFKVYSLFWCHI